MSGFTGMNGLAAGVGLLGVLFASPLYAASTLENETCDLDLRLRFVESAPRDRFIIENASRGTAEVSRLTINLVPSAGRLIFDTQAGGDGVEVFQRYRTEAATARLAKEPSLQDGGDALSLDFAAFGPGETHSFSIDVDDRLTNSDLGQIRVSGGEMAGAAVEATLTDGRIARGVFLADNTASVGACS